jgi:hypothetical protein
MSRSTEVLVAALLRPVNVLAPGVGLLASLTVAPWWAFPVSLVVYGVLVVVALGDRAFVQRALAPRATTRVAEAFDWRAVGEELGEGEWTAPLARIATAERNLAAEGAAAPETAQQVLASTLEQLRAAANLGVQLARRLRSLDDALRTHAGMDPDRSRREAADKRARAARAKDETAARAMTDAAGALDEAASTADSLRALRERTAAQLDGLAAMLESVAVRGVRLRVQSDVGSSDIAETLRAEMDAVRETLTVLESLDETSGLRSMTGPGR